MKSRILLLLLLMLSSSHMFGQSKAEQIRILEEENSALKETISQKEALLSEQKAYLEANRLEFSKNLFDLERLGAENTALRTREKVLLDSLQECNKFPPLIQSLKSGMQTIEFEDFWNKFDQNCYSGKNIDELIYKGSKAVMQFVNEDLLLLRKYNPGASCNLHDKKSNYGYFVGNGKVGQIQASTKGMTIFEDEIPEKGFCDPSPSPDGIYIQRIPKVEYYDVELGKMHEVKLPAKFKGAEIREVVILKEHKIQKHLYFIKGDNKWWFFLVDDCDCSA